MKTFAPNYYGKFKCISSKCKHNCCIGWEIDIDEDTYKKYQSVGGEFGKKLHDGINISDEVASFKLTEEKERCVFLREDNLCEIFCNLGESSLCQICTDHPRFRSFFESRTEIGLGLCCEEVARIILSQSKPFMLEVLEEDFETGEETQEEKTFFELRNEIFSHLYSSDEEPIRKADLFLSLCGCKVSQISFSWMADILLSLEKFDESSTEIFSKLKSLDKISNSPSINSFDNAFCNLLTYFIFRHLPLMFDGYSLKQIANFIVFCFNTVYGLCLVIEEENGKLEFEDLAELSRLVSCEIEYSDLNMETLLDLFE